MQAAVIIHCAVIKYATGHHINIGAVGVNGTRVLAHGYAPGLGKCVYVYNRNSVVGILSIQTAGV